MKTGEDRRSGTAADQAEVAPVSKPSRIGFIHCTVGIAFGLDTLGQIVSDGLVDAVEPHVSRMYWFWFMTTGLLMTVVGQLTHAIERRGGALPGYLGWEILALGVVVTAAIPVSGGWLVIGAGIFLLLKRRQVSPPVR